MRTSTNLMSRASRVLMSMSLVVSMLSGFGFGAVASASTANSLYSYTLTGSSSTVSNAAASNTGANLSLVGDWNQSSYGVHFAGDLVSKQSGGDYKPASGNTINVPSTSSVGAAVRFKYQAPASGNCFNDSSNITQVGRFAANTAQVKIQYSNCGNDSSHVFVECRMAGASTPSSVLPVRNALALVNGNDYIAKCYKTPDPSSGNATVTLRVVKVDTLYGNTVENDNFSVAPTGAITSAAYLSVANKFALPAQADNTDQFVGDVKKLSYCQATTTTAVSTCLGTEVPEPALAPSVINTSVSGPSSLQIGQQGTYTVTTTTSASTPGSNGVTSTLTVPSTMSIVSAAGATISGQTATWSLGNLGIGTTVNKTATVALNSGTVGNTATVSAATITTNGACSTSGSTCSASKGTTIAAGSVPVVQTSFGGTPTTLEPGQSGNYQVVVNLSQASSTGVVATLTVPSNVTILHAAGATISGQTATWNYGDITPRNTTTNVDLQLNSGTVGATIPVSLAVTTTDGACTDVGSVCSASTNATTVSNTSNVTLNTSMSGPSSLQVGQQGDYTTAVTNTTTNETSNGVSVTATVPSNMSIVSAHGGTVSGQTATWLDSELTPGSFAPRLTVQLNSGTTGDTATVSAAVTTADDACSISGSTCSASYGTTVAPGNAKLQLGFNQVPVTLEPGQEGTYQLDTLLTQASAFGVTTTLTVPANMTIVSATGATISGQTATWNRGDINPVHYIDNVTLRLDSGTVGDSIPVSFAATTVDSTCANTGSVCSASTSSTTISNSSNAPLTTGITGPNSLHVGDQGTYTTTVQNTGTNETAMGTTVVVTVPTNMTIVSASGATISGQTATWNLGSFSPGTATLSVVAQLNSGTPGDTATVAAATTTADDACSLSGSICGASVGTTVAGTIAPVVNTTVSGPSSLQPGQQGTYTATTQNTATGSTATGISTSVTVPSNMSIVSATGATIVGNTATWNNGDIAGGSSVTNTLVAQLNTGNGGDTATVSAATTTTDSSCTNTGSSCTSSTNTTVNQIITNSGVETNTTGWGGYYGSSSLVSNTQSCGYGAHTGNCDILVTALAGASNASLGFNDSPRWVTNTDHTKTYSGSVWVRASFVGQVIHFRLREWHGSTLVTDNNVTWTANTLGWHQITNSITPAADGNQLAFIVHGSGMNAGDSFDVDDMVLTSN
ncbi:MAG TPA: hypothetical protein VLF69_06015 [Candidatus Saccharimonadales bacterium]|nr:hypothetical protein [Candidatus Saccharimonadales bacterium]